MTLSFRVACPASVGVASHITRLLGIAALTLCVSLPAAAIELPWTAKQEEAPELPPRPVVTAIASDLPSALRSFPGVVEAGTEVELGFQTLGRLSMRPVDVGDDVETGDLLAELTPDDLQDNVRAARSAVDAAEVTLETAQATAERTRDLAKRSVATRAQLEQAERGLKAAEAGLAQAQSELARAEDAEGFARLLAPFSGVISAVSETPGAVVSAGTPIVTLSDVNTREAVIDLPEAVLSAMPVGTDVDIWLESDDRTRSTGQIIRIEAVADAATRTRRVHMSMDNPDNFRLGSLIRAQRGGERDMLLALPDSAIAGTKEDPRIWIVSRQPDGSATVELRPVTIGLRVNGLAAVASGLKVGEEVVVRGVHSLKDGQAVGERVEP
ncbi:efflux RND transporter periplasmic adaptor subunit [Paracoccus aurantiacus]|uniref:Efflux RND transporter periplasmic adaptor subunit n=1 Tax=Paracoccus aurantiacus TaxID=2599412 RepID=A0A5C6S2J6_9RHOB|nr:efflux RND transporter periplasmic adaptor subunit [Paracoccus aurantiacus]TXB68080.1 efflux RND transporter periplasmic adaptor subunit [Paracoccus aurantiacus]